MKADQRLSDALQTLAGQVEPSAAGYDGARREWQRREAHIVEQRQDQQQLPVPGQP